MRATLCDQWQHIGVEAQHEFIAKWEEVRANPKEQKTNAQEKACGENTQTRPVAVAESAHGQSNEMGASSNKGDNVSKAIDNRPGGMVR